MSEKPRFTLLFLVALLHLVAAVGVERTVATESHYIEVSTSLTGDDLFSFSDGSDIRLARSTADSPAANSSDIPAAGSTADSPAANSSNIPAAGSTADAPDSHPSTGDLHNHHDDRHHAVDPDRVRFLFSFQRQARPLNSLIRTQPVHWSESEATPVTTPDHPAEALMRFRLASTMIVSRTLHLSLTVRELLYPFHYFL